MIRYIWISYDLGIQGDYNHMYAWLDNHNAQECGDSMAYIKYNIPHEMNDEEFIEYLKNDLEKSISFKPGDRVYVIRKVTEQNSTLGKFIIGKRRANPWDGYGDSAGEESEDSQG